MGLAERPRHHQDRSLVDLQLGLFGVFDGVGEFAKSGEAAQLAAQTMAEVCRASGRATIDALVAGCNRAHDLIRERGLGATTATVAWVVGARALYVSVGDSRLYHHHAGLPYLEQVTTDEGEGNILFNVLGWKFGGEGVSLVKQTGARRLRSKDKLLLVTDGITGDFAPDLLSDLDLSAAIAGDDPQRAADRLLEVARKRDDQTALVVFVD